jgi:hypothetical protein
LQDQASKSNEFIPEERRCECGELGSPAEAQAGGKGIDIGVLTVHRPETIELFVLGDVMAEARWEL